MNPKLKKYLKAPQRKVWGTFAKILISVLALVFVFSKIELNEVIALLKKTRYVFVLLAVLLYALSQVVSSNRLLAFLQAINIPISGINNLKLYSLGMYYNLLLPGGISGDGYKLLYLKKKFKIKVKPLLQALLIDRAIGLLALIGLLLILPMFLPVRLPYQGHLWILLIPKLLMGYIIMRRLFNTFASIYLNTLIQSLLVQGLQILMVWFLLKAMGLSVVPMAYFFLFLLSSIAAAIPFTIGGAGARELVFLWGASWFGIDQNIAITMSLLFYVCTVVVSMGGIFFSFQEEWDVW